MPQDLLDFWKSHSGDLPGIIQHIVVSVLIIIIGIALSRTFRKIMKRAASGRFNVDGTVSSLLRYVVSYGIFIICVIMILNVFGVNTTSLIAVLGAAGVAIGLALKDTLGNIAAGIILLFLGSYRRGEFVEFGLFSGTVKDINLFTTILETPDGIYISAPNSSIWGTPLKNYTRNGKRRMELSVCVSCSDSLDVAFQVMREIMAGETRFLRDPAPQVLLQSVQEGYVTITIRAWAANECYWDIYWQQTRSIKEKIEEAGLHIAVPQRDVRLIQM